MNNQDLEQKAIRKKYSPQFKDQALERADKWNHSFKVEAIHGEQFLTPDTAKKHVFEYIEINYNLKRLHSIRGYKTSVSFEIKKVAQ